MSKFKKMVDARRAKTGEGWQQAAEQVRAKAARRAQVIVENPAAPTTNAADLLATLRVTSPFAVLVRPKTWSGRTSADPKVAFAPLDPSAGGPVAESGSVTRSVTREQAAVLLAAGAANASDTQVIRSFHNGDLVTAFSGRCSNCRRWIDCGTDDREDTCVCGQRYRVVFDLAEVHHATLSASRDRRCMDCGTEMKPRVWEGTRKPWRAVNEWQIQCAGCTSKSEPGVPTNIEPRDMEIVREPRSPVEEIDRLLRAVPDDDGTTGEMRRVLDEIRGVASPTASPVAQALVDAARGIDNDPIGSLGGPLEHFRQSQKFVESTEPLFARQMRELQEKLVPPFVRQMKAINDLVNPPLVRQMKAMHDAVDPPAIRQMREVHEKMLPVPPKELRDDEADPTSE